MISARQHRSSRGQLRRAGLGSVLALVSAMALPGSAFAHPHVWVSTRTTVIYDNGTVTGLRHRWLFDEFYSAGAVEGLDANKDGKVDRNELAELAKINIEGLKEFDYFTAARLGNKALEFGDARDVFMELIETTEAPGPQSMLSNDGPSPQKSQPEAAPPKSGGLWSRLSDAMSGWWGRLVKPGPKTAEADADKSKVVTIEFTLPLKQPVLAEAEGFRFTVQDPNMFIWLEMAGKDPVKLANAPPGCKAVIGDADLDDEQRRLQQAFGSVGSVAGGGTKTVTMTCGKP